MKYNYVPLMISEADIIMLARIVGGIQLNRWEEEIADERINQEIATGARLEILTGTRDNHPEDRDGLHGDPPPRVHHQPAADGALHSVGC